MSPSAAKTLMTIGAAVLGGLPVAFPVLVPFAPAFALASGALLGWAHGPQPGTAALKERAKAATDELAAHLEKE